MNGDDLPDAVLVLDRSLEVVDANGAAERLTAYRREQLVGSPVSVLAPRDRRGAPLLDGWHASAGLPGVRLVPEIEVTLRRADGGEVTVWAVGRYLRDPAGAVDGMVVALRHGSRRSRSPSGVEIVSTVSHELRSPLTSVKGYTSLLLKRWDRLDDEQKRMMLEHVNRDADRVTRLITELLDISRLETGRLVLRRQRVDLPSVATEVVDKVSLEYRDIECEVVFPDPFPQVYADRDKVVQVLTNLVENACKYASSKGMRIEGDVRDGQVALAVHDDGEGIPEDDLAKVFTKFFRRAETRPTGSGLGLWISRGLVEAHGGHLEARSAPGRGSTFRFTLPIEPPEAEA